MNDADIIRQQRAEIAALERSVAIYTEILADYEQRLAEARAVERRLHADYLRNKNGQCGAIRTPAYASDAEVDGESTR